MKYVIFKVAGMGEWPILFPDDITHAFMARTAKRAIESSVRVAEVEVVAAGFVNRHGGEATGFSESLSIKARPEDTALIQKHYPGVGRG